MGLGDMGRSALRLLSGSEDPPAEEKPRTEPQEIAGKVDALEVRKSRMKVEWKQNLAIYAGQHWIHLDKTSQAWVQSYYKYRETQAVLNLYKSYCAVLVSMLTRNMPVPAAVPVGNNPGDEERARVATALTRHAWLAARAFNADVAAVQWAVLTGNGIYKVYWDHERGTATYEDEEATGEVDEFGAPITQKVTKKFGMPVIEAVPPFCVGWNDTVPLAQSPWCYHKAVYTPEDVYHRYGVEVEPDSWPEDTQAGGVVRWDTTVKGSDKPFGVSIYDWYERPCKKFPNGRHVVCTKGKVLVDDEWPNENVWPLYHFCLEPTPGSPWGNTPFTDGVPIQKEIDRIVSDAMDHVTTAAYPQFMARKGQMKGAITRGPGKIYEVEDMPGAPMPAPVNIDRMESWVLQFIDQLKENLREVLGISAVMVGQSEYSRMSGRAGGQFIEQSTNRWVNAALAHGEVLKDIGVAILEMWRQYGPYETTVRVVGNDGIEAYVNAQRDGFSYSTLHLDIDDLLASSRWAKLEQLEKWQQYGVFDPQNPGAERFLRLAAKFSPDIAMLDETNLDRAWANRNLESLKNGVLPEVAPPMNFAVHFDVTANAMKTAEFFTYDPRIQQTFRAYLDALAPFAEPAPPPEAGGGIPPNAASPGGGIPGPVPSQPGPQGVPPEAAGSTNPPGVNLREESALAGMQGG